MTKHNSLKNINNKSNNQQGFTIIEVVLVLAIAGLIFLAVFLALPAMQKSQRDNARRQDVGKVVAGLQQYKADGIGLWPSAGSYSTGYFSNLAQASYVAVRASAVGCGKTTAPDAIVVAPGCDCSYSGTVDHASRKVAVHILMESGGAYCREM